jgi:hypothetical protein
MVAQTRLNITLRVHGLSYVNLSKYLPIKVLPIIVPTYQSIYLSKCLPIKVPTYQSKYLSMYLPIKVPNYQSTHLSKFLNPFTHLSVHYQMHLQICNISVHVLCFSFVYHQSSAYCFSLNLCYSLKLPHHLPRSVKNDYLSRVLKILTTFAITTFNQYCGQFLAFSSLCTRCGYRRELICNTQTAVTLHPHRQRPAHLRSSRQSMLI